jgi:hypothetical protein
MRLNRAIIWFFKFFLVFLMLGTMFPLGQQLAKASSDVPYFSQNYSSWECDPMVVTSTGEIIGTIGDCGDPDNAAGCTTTCAAMLLEYYGFETDPGMLNTWLDLPPKELPPIKLVRPAF